MPFPHPVLRRFAIRVLKDDGTGALVPAVGAVVKFYKQGATVKTGVVIPNNESRVVACYHTGVLDVGDRVQMGADETRELAVTALDQQAAAVTLVNQTGGSVSLSAGDRLVRTKKQVSPGVIAPDPALIHDDPEGVAAGAPARIADEDGRVEGYLKAYRFDYTITGAEPSGQVFVDETGSFVMR